MHSPSPVPTGNSPAPCPYDTFGSPVGATGPGSVGRNTARNVEKGPARRDARVAVPLPPPQYCLPAPQTRDNGPTGNPEIPKGHGAGELLFGRGSVTLHCDVAPVCIVLQGVPQLSTEGGRTWLCRALPPRKLIQTQRAIGGDQNSRPRRASGKGLRRNKGAGDVRATQRSQGDNTGRVLASLSSFGE
jgi:hypothetical protein